MLSIFISPSSQRAMSVRAHRLSHRWLPWLFVPFASACLGFTQIENSDVSGYALIRGSVSRADGTPVPNADIGLSCVGSTPDAFGQTVVGDANGRFEIPIAAPAGFQPLEGNTRVCRVLTPIIGTPQAQVTVTVRFSGSESSRPLTEVALVVP